MIRKPKLAHAHKHLVQDIRSAGIVLTGQKADYAPLLEMIGDASYVLIGEATHGTEEFYRIRAEITKQLIRYAGFNAIAIEGDWPDAYRINRYVKGESTITGALGALADFNRFPSWMWNNEVMLEFVTWLYEYNGSQLWPLNKVGFYGLDIYSLNHSIRAVIEYLQKVDPQAAKRAEEYYSCFDQKYTDDPQQYGFQSAFGMTPACEHEVIQQLAELQRKSYDYIKQNGFAAGEEYFCAEQNARAIVNAEKYYRTMFQNRVLSWNLRDQHMMETLNALTEHIGKQRKERAKIVVWAHNSHIGDARAAELGQAGEWNIGQLARQQYGHDAVLIGFSTYDGTVTAASKWDGPIERKTLRPAMAESYEALFHETGLKNFILKLRDNRKLAKHLNVNRLHRAIGVLYLPETEFQSHYFYARLAEQFDALIHIDRTTAIKPLETASLWHKGEVFETYPSGY